MVVRNGVKIGIEGIRGTCTFDLAVCKVIWGHLVICDLVTCDFRKYDFQNAASSTRMILLQSNLLQVLPVTVHFEFL